MGWDGIIRWDGWDGMSRAFPFASLLEKRLLSSREWNPGTTSTTAPVATLLEEGERRPR